MSMDLFIVYCHTGCTWWHTYLITRLYSHYTDITILRLISLSYLKLWAGLSANFYLSNWVLQYQQFVCIKVQLWCRSSNLHVSKYSCGAEAAICMYQSTVVVPKQQFACIKVQLRCRSSNLHVSKYSCGAEAAICMYQSTAAVPKQQFVCIKVQLRCQSSNLHVSKYSCGAEAAICMYQSTVATEAAIPIYTTDTFIYQQIPTDLNTAALRPQKFLSKGLLPIV